jgi:hypothetical protein
MISLKGALPYQRKPILHLMDVMRKKKIAYDGSDPGIGKTYMTCIAVRERKRSVFAVVPKTSVKIWYRVCHETKTSYHTIIGYEKLKTGKTPWGHWKYKNKGKESESKTWVWTLPPNVDLVLDECHRCKGIDSANAELEIAAKKQEVETFLLSATAAQDPTHMRAFGYCVELHDLTDFEEWCMQNGCYRGFWGKLEYSGSDTALQEVHRHIFPEWGIRVTIKSLGKRFPKTVIQPLAFDMSNAKKIEAVYREMDKQLTQWEMGCGTDKGMNPLTIILRARQKIELLKVPEFVELAKEHRANGMSVPIFVNFTDTLWAIANKLKTECTIWGGNKMGKRRDERQENIDRFQANIEPYIVCNMRAGGVSISLHDLIGGHPRRSLISPNYSAYDMLQVLGRPHRANGKSTSYQDIVFAAGTIEEKVCNRVREKMRNLATINDGDLLASEHLLPFLGKDEMGAIDEEESE